MATFLGPAEIHMPEVEKLSNFVPTPDPKRFNALMQLLPQSAALNRALLTANQHSPIRGRSRMGRGMMSSSPTIQLSVARDSHTRDREARDFVRHRGI